MQNLLTDLRSGIRMLFKYPTLSVGAILTLGLGLGMSTTVFCVVNGGLLKGLPFPDADRIVAVVATAADNGDDPSRPLSVHDLAVYQARQTVFDRIGAFGQAPLNIVMEGGQPERLSGGLLTVAAFESLGVTPVLGRGFREGDDRPGADPVALISHALWRDRFGGAPNVVGQVLRVNGTHRTIVGVMPETFGFPIRETMWIPLTVDPAPAPRGREAFTRVVARLKPGVSPKEARIQLSTAAAQLQAEFPTTNKGVGVDVVPYARSVFGPEIYNLLMTMLGAGIGVLLIACVNVSNLLAARASLRQREVAVRMALGAARSRVVRQHLTEVLVLAVLGAGVGILLSLFGMQWFISAMSADPPPFFVRFELDYRVLLFVGGLIVLASLFAGGMPALYASRVSAGAALKDEGRGSTSSRLGRFSGGLVVAELAVSCGLLIAAGLMVKSVVQLKTVDMPFAVDDILTARVDLPTTKYPDSAASIRFFEQLLPKVQSVPGVEAGTLSDGLPAAGNGSIVLEMQGKSYPQPTDRPSAREGIVTPGYFETFQVRILSGREFTTSDNTTGLPVAIVNESFAREHFPDGDAVGRQFKRVRPQTQEPWLTIVGVVPDLLMEGIGNNNASPVGYYIPIAQSDVANGVRIAVRTRGDAASLAPQLRAAVASLDADLALYDVQTLRRIIDGRTWFYTVFGSFFTAFGVCALVLAAAGLYGVMSFAVTQRTREMGVRSALGAPGRQLVALVMRRSVIQLGIGLALGLGMALAASSALQPVLYKVHPRDAGVFGAVILLLGVVSLLASFLPARRVAKVDPVLALTLD
jgi:putative ABC transport system permease protein